MNATTRSTTARKELLTLLVPIALIVAAGVWLFRDYGLSWDEPLFYKFARTMPRAYSIEAQRTGTFNFERDIDTDHWFYGPAYVLLATPAVRMFQALGLPEYDAWRLANLGSFVVGLIFLYLLARRWLEWPAALGVTLLTASQPVLWGHAFINPKDIPLMSSVIVAIHFGLRMVDHVTSPAEPAPDNLRAARRETIFKVLRAVGWAALGLLILTWALTPLWNRAIPPLIRALYDAPAQSLLGRLFASFASGAATTPVEVYIDLGLEGLPRLRQLVTLVLLPFALLGLVLTLGPGLARRALRWLDDGPLGPLPSAPSIRTTSREFLYLGRRALLPGIALGIAISIRVVSPLVGILVVLYFLLQPGKRSWWVLLPYTLVAGLTSYATWPYLWGAPLARFVQVFRHMASNPKILSVLFNGQVFPSDGLPAAYLPTLLARTLTEPVWLLFIAGLTIVALAVFQRRLDWRPLAVILLWLFVPVAYILILRPPMYDGYRHFLFMVPPAFLFGGFALQALFTRLRTRLAQLAVVGAVAGFGILGIARTHPYEYASYNILSGGMGGAFRRFETDYWLTCYKESMDYINQAADPQSTLLVLRQAENAQYYAVGPRPVEDFEPNTAVAPGSLLLATTRTNLDRDYFPEAPILDQVETDGAVLCVVRQLE